MLLPGFEYHEPLSLDEACKTMSGLGTEARIIAGGTDLLVNMKKNIIAPKNLVSLDRIPGLKKTDSSSDQVSIGCQVTATEISESSVIKKYFPMLAEGSGSLGSPLIRNRATIAGNVITARPAADSLPSLMVLEARIILKKDSGERELDVAEFIKGPGETLLQPEEILTTIMINKLPPFSGGAYIKLGQRKALEISLVNVASLLILEGEQGPIKEARIVMGAVGPTPLRALEAEKSIRGAEPGEDLFIKAGEIAAGECRPITDHRASAEYRRWMVSVLTNRTLAKAYERAAQGSRPKA